MIAIGFVTAVSMMAVALAFLLRPKSSSQESNAA